MKRIKSFNESKENPKTLGEPFEFLDTVATATKSKGKIIEDNKELEKQRANDVKNIEDMIEDIVKKDGVNYQRKYSHLYQK